MVTRRHFDDVHWLIEGVRYTMHGTDRDAGRLVDSQVKLPVIQGEARLAANTLGTPAAATIKLPILRLLFFTVILQAALLPPCSETTGRTPEVL